jgi:hypothetical protein
MQRIRGRSNAVLLLLACTAMQYVCNNLAVLSAHTLHQEPTGRVNYKSAKDMNPYVSMYAAAGADPD